jgi:hypothetical protein
MASIKDIIDRMESKPIIHILKSEDREDNRQCWSYYYQRTHRRSRECKYDFNEWQEINDYLFEHQEN